jgi:hypothetical protein
VDPKVYTTLVYLTGKKNEGRGPAPQGGPERSIAGTKKSRDCAETYIWYVAQGIPLIDAEIAKKGHFWMETN